jgi:hypothetical protein
MTEYIYLVYEDKVIYKSIDDINHIYDNEFSNIYEFLALLEYIK